MMKQLDDGCHWYNIFFIVGTYGEKYPKYEYMCSHCYIFIIQEDKISQDKPFMPGKYLKYALKQNWESTKF